MYLSLIMPAIFILQQTASTGYPHIAGSYCSASHYDDNRNERVIFIRSRMASILHHAIRSV